MKSLLHLLLNLDTNPETGSNLTLDFPLAGFYIIAAQTLDDLKGETIDYPFQYSNTIIYNQSIFCSGDW